MKPVVRIATVAVLILLTGYGILLAVLFGQFALSGSELTGTIKTTIYESGEAREGLFVTAVSNTVSNTAPVPLLYRLAIDPDQTSSMTVTEYDGRIYAGTKTIALIKTLTAVSMIITSLLLISVLAKKAHYSPSKIRLLVIILIVSTATNLVI